MDPTLAALVEAGIISQADAERIDRQLDPDRAREYAEQLLTDAFRRGLTAQQRRILDLVRDTDGDPTQAQVSRLWDGEDDLLWASVGDELRDIAIEQAVRVGINVDNPDMWMLVNEEVSTWVDTYYTDPNAGAFGSVPNLNATSRAQFATAFEDWQRGDRTPGNSADGLPQLINELLPIFGPQRAERIAITEVSRVFAQAEIASARANEFVEYLLWNTGNDELVCPICGPRDGQVVGKQEDGVRVATDGFVGYPPAHPRCRCSLSQLTGPAYAALVAGEAITPSAPVPGPLARAVVEPEPEPARPIPPVAQTPTFATAAEAESWAKGKVARSVDYTGIDADLANTINNAVDTVLTRFSGQDERPRVLGATKDRKVVGNDTARATVNGIAFHPKRIMEGVARAEQGALRYANAGVNDPKRWSIDPTPEGIITHEMGHWVHYQNDLLIGRGQTALQFRSTFDSLAAEERSRYRGVFSEYGLSDANEFFAESFTLYWKDPELLPRPLFDFIEGLRTK